MKTTLQTKITDTFMDILANPDYSCNPKGSYNPKPLVKLFSQEQLSLIDRLEERYNQISGTYKSTERDWEAVIDGERLALEKIKKEYAK